MTQPPTHTFPPSTSTPLEYSLFSPSKAAEQQRLAKDWTYIHHFLARKYPFPQKVPKFEENEDTLKALLAFAAANEKADEGWVQLCGVEELVLGELEGEEEPKDTTTILNNTLTKSLQTSLSSQGTTTLTSQATTAITLNTTPSAKTLATALLTLSTTLSSLHSQLNETKTLKANLVAQNSSLHSELQTLTSGPFTMESNLPKRTAEITRQTKVLKAKVNEYDERLRNASASGVEIPEALLADVEMSKSNLQALVQRVKEVEQRIEEFEGVPPEAREVRKVMQDLRAELEEWVRRRDEKFESLVGGRR
ncbi:hypothetical protein E4T48_05932 [Aureobasidium sp. EXF-10727]|nr:hypothetical protein E4T48_05932 [Aureobasidium sp. EXF-10727]